jgi:hypothetical protein
VPIRIACSCGKRLNAPDSLAGKTGKCPACGARIAIPGPGPAAPAQAASDKPPPPGPRPGSLPKPWWVPRLLACGIGLIVGIVLMAIGTRFMNTAGEISSCVVAAALLAGFTLMLGALIGLIRPRSEAEWATDLATGAVRNRGKQAARIARIRAKADACALRLAAAESAGADPMTLSKQRLALACDYCICGFFDAAQFIDGDRWAGDLPLLERTQLALTLVETEARDGDFSLLARAKQELQWLVANSPNPRDRKAAQKRLGPLLADVEKWRAAAQHLAAAKPDSPEAQAARAYLERLEEVFPVA